MERINLYSEEKRKDEFVLTQEQLDKSFAVEIPPEVLIEFGEAQTQDKRQEILNRIFTKDRRQRMFAAASKDIKGRPVRYYRYLSTPQFESLLEKGSQTSYDLLESGDQEFDEGLLRGFLADYYLEDFTDGDKKLAERSLLLTCDLSDLFLRIFPSAPRSQIEEIVRTRRLADVRRFIDDHVPNVNKQRLHNSYYSMLLSPFLALSVGGPFKRLNDRWPTIYIEVVLPDSSVILKPQGFKAEKEVVVRQIQLSNISRVYFAKQLDEEVVKDPTSPMGEHEAAHRPGVWDPFLKWAARGQMVDVLPVSILSKYQYLLKRFDKN